MMGLERQFSERVSLLAGFILLLRVSAALASEKDLMVAISGGTYTPIIKSAGKAGIPRAVRPFLIDRYPVTVEEYLSFARSHPEWRRSQRTGVFADSHYLEHWQSDFDPGGETRRPVTEVSWFAARAYCESHGKRLPTAAEWEFIALASETERDASADAAFATRILSWYSSPRDSKMAVGNFRNAWGVYDMHGLIWEWVEDFNGEFTSGDSRGDNSEDESAFCGGSALNVSDAARTQYAAFMRYAFRGSLRGNYAIDTLGFRCSKDLS